MPSKYKKVNLPVFQQESSFQMKVEEWKKTYGDNPEDANISVLAKTYADVRLEKDLLEEKISEINIALEALNQMAVSAMQAMEMDSVKLSSGATVYLSCDVYPQVKDKEQLIAWAKKNGLEGSFTLPWQTLRGLCNELSTSGKPLPKGVEAYLRISLRVRNNGEK